MKKITLIFAFLIVAVIKINAQNITIPDANFKAALVANLAINTNSDAEIQALEAAAYNGTIDVSNLSIADLTGIEAFTALTSLDASYNQLTSLDVSANTALTDLNCRTNELTSLDISENIALTSLRCQENLITSLDVTSNIALTRLQVSYNQLTSLDVSANVSLTNLGCSVNQLTSLDLSSNTLLNTLYCLANQLTSLSLRNGNNSIFIFFDATVNPNLTCIQVDDVAYFNEYFPSGKDDIASYSDNCLYTGMTEANNNVEISFYPNPFSSNLTMHSNKILKNATATLYTIQGIQVKQIKNISEQTFVISRENYPSGLYFVQIAEGDSILTTNKVIITQ